MAQGANTRSGIKGIDAGFPEDLYALAHTAARIATSSYGMEVNHELLVVAWVVVFNYVLCNTHILSIDVPCECLEPSEVLDCAVSTVLPQLCLTSHDAQERRR